MSTTLRIGGVPEHYNEPWKHAIETGVLGDAEWTDYPGGTGELLRALDDESIDVGVLLTEGTVKAVAGGQPIRVVGTWVATPLVWGIHVAAESEYLSASELSAARFAISRPTSGSHVMSYVHASNEGWNPSALRFVEVGTLDGAREAFESDDADVFMWEKYTTKWLVDQGEWRRVGECVTPWPSFVVVVREDDVDTIDVTGLLERVRASCERFMNDPDFAVEWISARHEQQDSDIRAWLTETRWAASPSVSTSMLQSVAETLVRVGAIDEAPPASDVVAPWALAG